MNEDILFIQQRIRELEEKYGKKIDVDMDNLTVEDLAEIAKAYGITIRKLFNP